MSTAQNKWTAKEAIQVGIYTALYFVVAMVMGSIGFLLILYPVAPMAIALVGGSVFVLFLTKVRHFGMVTVMGALISAALALTGHGLYSLLFGIPIAIVADAVCKIGQYRTFKWIRLAHGIFSLLVIGSYLPMFLAADDFYKSIGASMGEAYATSLRSYMPLWMFPIIIVLAFIGGIIGAQIGKILLKKHFQRAGITG